MGRNTAEAAYPRTVATPAPSLTPAAFAHKWLGVTVARLVMIT